MKKITLLSSFFIALLLFAGCSSDDNNSVPEPELDLRTPQERLAEDGPWTFNSVEVVEITEQSEPPKTESEIITITSNDLATMSFTFYPNNTGTATMYGETGNFEYSVSQNTISFGNSGLDDWSNFEFTENGIKFTMINSAVSPGDNHWNAAWYYGRFSLDKAN